MANSVKSCTRHFGFNCGYLQWWCFFCLAKENLNKLSSQNSYNWSLLVGIGLTAPTVQQHPEHFDGCMVDGFCSLNGVIRSKGLPAWGMICLPDFYINFKSFGCLVYGWVERYSSFVLVFLYLYSDLVRFWFVNQQVGQSPYRSRDLAVLLQPQLEIYDALDTKAYSISASFHFLRLIFNLSRSMFNLGAVLSSNAEKRTKYSLSQTPCAYYVSLRLNFMVEANNHKTICSRAHVFLVRNSSARTRNL